MLQIHRLVLHGNGLLHRNHMHADACPAGRHHLGDARQRYVGHTLKESRHIRVLLQSWVTSVGKLLHVEQLG